MEFEEGIKAWSKRKKGKGGKGEEKGAAYKWRKYGVKTGVIKRFWGILKRGT